jgi:HemY protein
MIRFVIIAVLLFIVIAITPMLISDPGYISIAIAGKVIEMTVFTAIFWLSFILVVLFLTFKVLRGGLKLSFKGFNKVAFASRRRAIRDFNKGIAAYVLEDYQQAELLLAKSAEPAQEQQTAYLLAASAASKQNLAPNTRHYLAQLSDHKDTVKKAGLDAVIINIQLLLAQQDHKEARALLDDYHKHVGHDARLLKLEIDLCLIEQRYDTVIDYLPMARKQKSLNEDIIAAWEDNAYFSAFSERIRQHDHQTLQDYWQKIPRKIRHKENVLFAYCQVLAKHNIIEPLEKLLLPSLKKEASESFLKRLRSLPIDQTVHKAENLIQAVQKHLQRDANNAKWLSCLGHLSLFNHEWLMAEKAFNSLFNLATKQYDHADLQACAQALIAQEKYQQASKLLLVIVEE